MWQLVKDAVFYCIEFFYNFCGDWGLAIIIITIIFRLLMTPLVYKQSKSSYQTQKMQPKIDALQKKFADDPVRLREEQQALYAQAHFNPLAGCIPMLIQMPIFIALFQVLRELEVYMVDASNYCFYNIVPDLVMTPSAAWAISMRTFVPYVILLLIFALATFLPMFLQQLKQESSQRTMMLVTSVIMTIMMLWIGWSSPAGVLLFWGASSIIGIIQMRVSTRICKKNDKEQEEIAFVEAGKPVEVDVTRKVQKKRKKKKNKGKNKR